MINLQTLERIALSFPGVEAGTSYGTPGFRVRGKFLARLWEDGETLVLRVGFDERDVLIQADPEVFFLTDHYLGYPAVLIHLPRIKTADFRKLFEQAWRGVAPKRLIAEADRRG